MAITNEWVTHTKGVLSADGDELQITTGYADLCDQLSQPSHVFLQIYAAGASEIVLADACRVVNGRQVIHTTRGMDGTKPRTWPDGACVCVVRIVPGAVPGAGWETEPFCDCPDPWEQLQVANGLTFDKTDPDSPVLSITDTGVVAGDYGGAAVNSRGQFTYIPPGWPASALPVFDPCACAGAGGGAGQQVAASDVSYDPQLAHGILTSHNVQGALQQAEDAIVALQVQGTGVNSITVGAGLQNTGTNANPVLSLTNTGITPGTYSGLTVDAQGRVTGYTPVAADDVHVTVNAPLTVNFDGATKTYDLNIEDATATERGVVTIISPGVVLAGNVPPAEQEKVLTYEGGLNLLNEQAKTIVAGEVLSGGGQLVSDITLNVDVGVQPMLSTQPPAPEFLIHDTGLTPAHQRASANRASDIVRGAHAQLVYDGSGPSVTARKNINNVTVNATGDYTIDMVAADNMNYIVLAFPDGDEPGVSITAEVLSASQFRVRVRDGGALSDKSFRLVVFKLL